jgi:signal transduction histidine kinase
VRACNRDGIWDRRGFVYNITQQPYFYETRLFQAAEVGLTLVLLAVTYQLRLRQMTARMNVQFDARIEERTRLARELHDTLLQTIQASKMIAEHTWMTFREDTRDPRTRALAKLAEWQTRALGEARAALESLRGSTTETNDLAEAFRDAGVECIAGYPIDFHFAVSGSAKELHPIVRDEIYRIGYEAIRNACMHSGGSRVEAVLSYGHDLILTVSDDGKGIDPEIVAKGRQGHFGLKGMQERAARIQAKLSVATSAESGTRVALLVPGHLIFRDRRPFWRRPLRARNPQSPK